MKIVDIWFSIETQSSYDPEKIDHFNEHTDVIVKLDDGHKYIASFFTYLNISKLKLEHFKSGEFLGGKYFRVDNMVLVNKCTRTDIEEVVEHLIDEGDFKSAFRLLSH